MQQSLDNTKSNTPSNLIRWWTEPLLWGFGLLYAIGLIITLVLAKGFWSTLFSGLGIIVAIVFVLFVARSYSPQSLDIQRPDPEWRVAIGWYVSFIVLTMIWRGEGFLTSEFGKWLWFLIIPLGLLLLVRSRKPELTALLRSVGFQRNGLGRALRLGFLASLCMAPFVILAFPAPQLQEMLEILQKPWKLLVALPIAFILALLTAGFTEEVFFRGTLQSRLAKVTGSEMRSCVLVAFLFGMYHLPYAYFLPSWSTHGNLAWAFSVVLTEHMLRGLLMGVLWLRTHNIAASVLFHSLVNTLPLITMLLG